MSASQMMEIYLLNVDRENIDFFGHVNTSQIKRAHTE